MESLSLKSLPVPSRIFTRGSLLSALTFSIVIVFATTHARADILSVCGNAAVVEGQPGLVDCIVTNLGADPVVLTGVFSFSEPIGGDFSDKLTSVVVLGPNPPCDVGTDLEDCPSTVGFQVFFTTTPAHADAHPDVGQNDVSLILRFEDAITGDFVNGLYGSAEVDVFDVGLTPVVPTTVGGFIPILSEEDYDDTVDDAESRGLVTNVPEPAPLLLLGTGLLGAVSIIRRRYA